MHRSESRWQEHQDTRGSRWIGQSDRGAADDGEHERHHGGRETAQPNRAERNDGAGGQDIWEVGIS